MVPAPEIVSFVPAILAGPAAEILTGSPTDEVAFVIVML